MDANGDRSAGEQHPLAELSCTERGATAGGQSSLQLHISLFLILIAFFMVLNALSNQEVTRRGAVIESVQNAFRRPLPRAEDLDLLAGRQLDAHMAEFHEALAGIFAAMTEFPGQFGWPGRGLIRAELPAASFFAGTDDEIRADRARMLDDLAATLIRGHAGERRAIEILVAVPPALLHGADADDAARNSHLARAAALARALEVRGVPGNAITTGVMADDRDLLWLTFGSRPVDREAE